MNSKQVLERRYRRIIWSKIKENRGLDMDRNITEASESIAKDVLRLGGGYFWLGILTAIIGNVIVRAFIL